jgi:hypothetical protein
VVYKTVVLVKAKLLKVLKTIVFSETNTSKTLCIQTHLMSVRVCWVIRVWFKCCWVRGCRSGIFRSEVDGPGMSEEGLSC